MAFRVSFVNSQRRPFRVRTEFDRTKSKQGFIIERIFRSDRKKKIYIRKNIYSVKNRLDRFIFPGFQLYTSWNFLGRQIVTSIR